MPQPCRWIIPALAGNTRTAWCMRRTPQDHPRSRGEYLTGGDSVGATLGSSPLSRGIHERNIQCDIGHRIIPALAGNTVHRGGSADRHRDHPRSRGEYPPRAGYPPGWDGSSPLSRGIRLPGRLGTRVRRIIPALTGNTVGVGFGGLSAGIIPALAGNTTNSTSATRPQWDHPRSRGEYEPLNHSSSTTPGSSPLSRGIPDGCRERHVSARIIPALAGNTLPRAGRPGLPGDHPRSRGEYRSRPQVAESTTGSSPLSRGIHRYYVEQWAEHRIIPALAGNTYSAVAAVTALPDHPRSRGEYLDCGPRGTPHWGSSPLSRGILVPTPRVYEYTGIIPALAGNTLMSWAASTRRSDHPRSRGEYGRIRVAVGRESGSSPLSRGILRSHAIHTQACGIIPALAGNTPGRLPQP